MIQPAHRLLTLCCLVSCVIACDRPKRGADPEPSDTITLAEQHEVPNVVLGEIEQVAAQCRFDAMIRPVECRDEALPRQLIETARERGLQDSYLSTVEALHSRDPATQQAATWALQEAIAPLFVRLDEGKSQGLDGAATERLIRHVETLNPGRDRRARAVIGATVEAAGYAGLHDQARALIEVHDPAISARHKEARYVALSHAMAGSRMALFESVIKPAATKDAPIEAQRAAMRAPIKMRRWSEAESDTLCTWAAPMVAREDGDLATSAARLLGRCRDRATYGGALLKGAIAQRAEGRYAMPYAVVATLCAPDDPLRDEALCGRIQTFLEEVVGDESLSGRDRSRAAADLVAHFPGPRSEGVVRKTASEAGAGLRAGLMRALKAK